MHHQFRNYQTKLWHIDNDDDTVYKSTHNQNSSMHHQFRNYKTKLWHIDNDDDTVGKLVPANLVSVCQSGCYRTPAPKHHIIIMTINVRSKKLLSPFKRASQ